MRRNGVLRQEFKTVYLNVAIKEHKRKLWEHLACTPTDRPQLAALRYTLRGRRCNCGYRNMLFAYLFGQEDKNKNIFDT